MKTNDEIECVSIYNFDEYLVDYVDRAWLEYNIDKEHDFHRVYIYNRLDLLDELKTGEKIGSIFKKK